MVGENCVYVAEKISADEYSAEYDEKAEKTRVQAINASQIPGQILNALYYKAKVVDDRYKIF